MKKLMAVFSIVFASFIALLAIPMIVSAEKVELEGKGVLMARGTGKAEIEGRLNFRGQARAAVLVVEDKAGDAKIEVQGYKKRIDEGNGRVRYVGLDGRARVKGSHVAIDLQGKNIRFVVRGAGEATLKGKGVYRVSGGELKQWSQDGVTAKFDDSSTDGGGSGQ